MNTNRYIYNKKIVEIINSWIENYPDLRFNQILADLHLDNPLEDFHEESDITYNKIIQSLRK